MRESHCRLYKLNEESFTRMAKDSTMQIQKKDLTIQGDHFTGILSVVNISLKQRKAAEDDM